MSKARECPICGGNCVETEIEFKSNYEYIGRGTKVSPTLTKIMVCTNCGKDYFTPRQNHELEMSLQKKIYEMASLDLLSKDGKICRLECEVEMLNSVGQVLMAISIGLVIILLNVLFNRY